MAGSELTALLMNCDIEGFCETSCAAIVVKNSAAFPRSRSPLLKKKLAPRTPCFLKRSATVREMVPRACYTVQPEDALAARIVGPCFYLMEQVDAGIGMASRVVLLGAGVECSIICCR